MRVLLRVPVNKIVATVYLLLLAGLLASCGGSVSGGEQTITRDTATAVGAVLRVNNVTGSDASDGISQPFESLQFALDQLRPGDRLVVESTAVPYSSNALVAELFDGSGNTLKTLRGFVLATSGTPSQPITIEGEGAMRPVIDQGQGSSVPGDAVLGLYLDCVSHIVIRGLEIRNVNEAGITSPINGFCQSQGITIEDNYIHSVTGEKYVAGIRMMGVSELLVRNNQLDNITSNESVEDAVFGYGGAGLDAIVVEGNAFSGLDVGVLVNAQGLGSSSYGGAEEPVSGVRIDGNRFTNVVDGVRLVAQAADALLGDESATGSFHDVDVLGNVFDTVDSALDMQPGAGDFVSGSTCFFNNTVLDASGAVVELSAVNDFEFFNNILVRPQADTLLSRAPANVLLGNTIAYSDNNLFWDFVALDWQLAVGGADAASFAGLAAWQMAGMHPELASNPDIAAINNDPLFSNAAMADYSLLPGSPAASSGRFAMSLGADFVFPANAGAIVNPCIERTR